MWRSERESLYVFIRVSQGNVSALQHLPSEQMVLLMGLSLYFLMQKLYKTECNVIQFIISINIFRIL